MTLTLTLREIAQGCPADIHSLGPSRKDFSAKGVLLMSRALPMSNPSIPSKLSCQAGVARNAQITRVARSAHVLADRSTERLPDAVIAPPVQSVRDFSMMFEVLRGDRHITCVANDMNQRLVKMNCKYV